MSASAAYEEIEWRLPTLPISDLTAEDIMTAAQAAVLLRCSTRHVYDLVARNELPGGRYLGNTVLVVRPVLVHWLLTGKRPEPDS